MEYIEHPDITEYNRNGELSNRKHKRLMAFVSGFNFEEEEEEEESEDD
jgi:hypothetical protein